MRLTALLGLTRQDLLDPAIIGTTGILKSIKKSAPSVKRVVITSSFAAIINPSKGNWPGHEYSEEDFNPMTQQDALESPAAGYRASKTFAEKAAWDFVEKEKPNFTISTINPPLVFGPIVRLLQRYGIENLTDNREDPLNRQSGQPQHLEPAHRRGGTRQMEG